MSETLQFVDLGALYREIKDEIDAAIRRVCESTAFISGPEVANFEQAFASFTGAERAIGVANGTDAIELALQACELPAGAEVIVPANTFIATAEAVVAAGLRPVFVDVEPDTGLIDPAAAEEAAGSAAAIIPVHLYGRLVDMDAIRDIARRHGLRVIEDAAQAHAARRGGRHAGTWGDAGTFSFYPGKNLGAFGDAGAVVTGDAALAERIETMRDHGRRGRDRHVLVGANSRLDGLQAAILGAKLPHLERWTDTRRMIAEAYRASLPSEILDWAGDEDEPEAESHHLFPVLLDDREVVAERLRAEGIPTGVHYRVALPCTPAFGERFGVCPVAEDRSQRQLSLPIHPHMSTEDAERVAAAVSQLVGAPR
jgi:dTDP-4-amino-4,6-dideoxygalactose transaminase